jgi:valyl-tRNA synthetase
MTAMLCFSASISTGVRAFAVQGPTRSAAFVQSLASKQHRTIRLRKFHGSLAASTAEPTTAYDLMNKEKGLDKYDPSSFESEIYKWWESSGCFDPDAKQKPWEGQKSPYVLPMPPPNVTGRLHMGHAIFVALQDVLARFHRMRGRPVLWLPGTFFGSF